jgi:protein-S-isoprenylcysteine O-methyltransferase Ste14
MYPLAIDVIRSCWITFGIVWLLAAISTKRSVYRENRIERLRYSIALVAGCFLLFRGDRMAYPLNMRVIVQMNAIALIAVILCVAGLVFCIWARITLGRNWSGTITLKEKHELIVRGPYRFVRHPIYTGLLAMVVATVIIVGHVAAIVGAVLVFASFWIKLSSEEEVMLKQFPDQYAAYRQRVRRLIPFVL